MGPAVALVIRCGGLEMASVNLDLQIRFLKDLERALDEALEKHAHVGDGKLSELTYMRREVERASKIVTSRATTENRKPRQTAHAGSAASMEAAF